MAACGGDDDAERERRGAHRGRPRDRPLPARRRDGRHRVLGAGRPAQRGRGDRGGRRWRPRSRATSARTSRRSSATSAGWADGPGRAAVAELRRDLRRGPARDPAVGSGLANLAAAAYLGQCNRIQDRNLLASVLAIHSVEGRQAAAVSRTRRRGRGRAARRRVRRAAVDGAGPLATGALRRMTLTITRASFLALVAAGLAAPRRVRRHPRRPADPELRADRRVRAGGDVPRRAQARARASTRSSAARSASCATTRSSTSTRCARRSTTRAAGPTTGRASRSATSSRRARRSSSSPTRWRTPASAATTARRPLSRTRTSSPRSRRSRRSRPATRRSSARFATNLPRPCRWTRLPTSKWCARPTGLTRSSKTHRKKVPRTGDGGVDRAPNRFGRSVPLGRRNPLKMYRRLPVALVAACLTVGMVAAPSAVAAEGSKAKAAKVSKKSKARRPERRRPSPCAFSTVV